MELIDLTDKSDRYVFSCTRFSGLPFWIQPEICSSYFQEVSTALSENRAVVAIEVGDYTFSEREGFRWN